jgi:hypothetical protein
LQALGLLGLVIPKSQDGGEYMPSTEGLNQIIFRIRK